MSYDIPPPQQTLYAQDSAVDVGLQTFMRGVFNTMALGLVLTGAVAFGVAHTPALTKLIFGTPLRYVAIFAPLAFLWFGLSSSRVQAMSSEKVRGMFYLFSALIGLSMASIFLVFTQESIAKVFFITAATFAAMSLYGYTTKRDLSRMGSFLIMGVMGIFIASMVNIFLQSPGLHFVISCIGVVAFTGLTAWDVQRLRDVYMYNGRDDISKIATMGALSLYLDFINLFQSLLSLMGDRR